MEGVVVARNDTWCLEVQRASASGEDVGSVNASWRVHATRDFEAGEVVECCKALTLRRECHSDARHHVARKSAALCRYGILAKTSLGHTFDIVFPAGYGALYRRVAPEHACLCAWVEPGGQRLVLIACVAIAKGSELTVSLETLREGFPTGAYRKADGAIGDCGRPCWSRLSNQADVGDVLRCGSLGGKVKAGPSHLHGYGVFSSTQFLAGDVVETCPFLALDDLGICAMSDYVMTVVPLGRSSADADAQVVLTYPPQRQPQSSAASEAKVVLPLGCGPLYNHSNEPNVEWASAADGSIVFIALHDIVPDTELFISYGSAYWSARQPCGNVVQTDNYGCKEYWDRRYSSSSMPFSWVASYSDVVGIVRDCISGNHACHILNVGCGTCTIPEELYDEGYKNITNVDFSPDALDFMKARNSQTRPEMLWLEADMTRMSSQLGLGGFGLVIDKFTCDALLCNGGCTSDVRKYLLEVALILDVRGTFLCMSINEPDVMLQHLQNPDVGFVVHWERRSLEHGRTMFTYTCTPRGFYFKMP